MEEILKQTLSTVGIALLSLAGTYIIFYINKLNAKIKVETAKIQDERQKALVDNALDRIIDLTRKTVIATQETTAKKLKLDIWSGIKDKEDLIALGGIVANDIYKQLSPQVIELAQTEINDVKVYILNEIENQVKILK